MFTLGFIFFDLDKKYPFKLSFLGIVVLILYMAYAIPFSNIEACKSWWGEPPYVFINYQNVGIWIAALLPGFIIGSLVLSMLLWLLNRIAYLIFVGDEVKSKEVETEEEKELGAACRRSAWTGCRGSSPKRRWRPGPRPLVCRTWCCRR